MMHEEKSLEKIMKRLEQTEAQLQVLSSTGYYSRSIDELIGVYKGCCYCLRDFEYITDIKCLELATKVTEAFEIF